MAGPGNATNNVITGITGFTGTGFTSTPATANAVQIGGATSSTLTSLALGTSGWVLTSNGAGLAPSFQAAAAGGIPTIGASTDNAVVRWDGAGGTAVQNSAVIIDDSANVSAIASLTVNTGGALRTSTSAGNTLLLQGYDTDTGPAYITFVTITAGTTPTCIFRGSDGTAGAPTYSFATNTNMGFYKAAADAIGVSFLGAQFVTWSGTGFASTVTGRYFLQEAQTDANPTYSFAADTNSGWYRSAADTLHMVTAGNKAQSWSSAGVVTFPLQPSFLAYLATTATNKTGNGTSYTLGTDALTEVFDRGNNFNTNGTFTAPVTGLYDLRAQITITGTTIATSFVISIVTTARTYISTFTRSALATDETVAISCIADMSATNTATVTIVASGEAADTDDILGAATLQTFFCGTLVA